MGYLEKIKYILRGAGFVTLTRIYAGSISIYQTR